jgi:hypothetical protein
MMYQQIEFLKRRNEIEQILIFHLFNCEFAFKRKSLENHSYRAFIAPHRLRDDESSARYHMQGHQEEIEENLFVNEDEQAKLFMWSLSGEHTIIFKMK